MEKLGVQIYGLKDEFQSDFKGTLQKLHKIGFGVLEPIVVFNEKQGEMPMNIWALETFLEAQKILKSLGIEINSVHAGIGSGDKRMPAEMAAMKILEFHEKTGIKNFTVSGVFEDEEGAKKWALLLKEITVLIEEKDCKIHYHNHDTELKEVTINGEEMILIDYFLQLTSPKVMLQLDIGWARFGDVNELEVAKKYADRIVSIHLKDFIADIQEKTIKREVLQASDFAPIGEGYIETLEILKLRHTFSNYENSIIIDQDFSGGSMLDDLEKGYQNVMKML